MTKKIVYSNILSVERLVDSQEAERCSHPETSHEILPALDHLYVWRLVASVISLVRSEKEEK